MLKWYFPSRCIIPYFEQLIWPLVWCRKAFLVLKYNWSKKPVFHTDIGTGRGGFVFWKHIESYRFECKAKIKWFRNRWRALCHFFRVNCQNSTYSLEHFYWWCLLLCHLKALLVLKYVSFWWRAELVKRIVVYSQRISGPESFLALGAG